MPVVTNSAMNGYLSIDLERMDCRLMLSNTYYFTLQSGQDFINDNYSGIQDYAIQI